MWNGAVKVADNLIADNGARVYGGGIYASNYTTLADNTVRGNTADTWGGGIYAVYAVTITANSLVENRASMGGGVNAGHGADLVGNTIARNTATEQGSGLYYVGSGSILSNTIVANTAPDTSLTIGGVGINRTPQLHYNSLYGNSPYDVVIVSSDDVSGTLNYWGTTSSVNILDQVYDWYDDSNRGKLRYIPYLQDPDPEAPVPPPLNLTADWHKGWVALEWDPIPSGTTGYGYKVYYDSDSSGPPYNGSGLAEGDSPIDVGELTAFALHGLEEETPYYAAITAYESLGREGWYSNEVNNLEALMDHLYLPLVLRTD